MLGRFSKFNAIVLAWTSLILAIVNTYTIELPLIGFVCLLGLILGLSRLIGPFFFPEQKIYPQIFTGFVVIISLIATIGSAFYYLTPIPKLYFVLLMVAITVFSTLVSQKNTVEDKPTAAIKSKIFSIGLAVALAVLLVIVWFGLIVPIQITDSVRTLWEVVPVFSILILSVCLLLTAALLLYERIRGVAICLIAICFFAAISLAVFIFPLGFGFDPFIHQATILHIAQFGTITPKPLYYIGQYVLELMTNHVFSLPIWLTDRLLTPLLAAILITGSAAIGFKSLLKENFNISLLAIFLLPLSAFIITTPQSLAYVLTATLLFLSLTRFSNNENKVPLPTLGLITIAALLTHPLAGIPAAIYFSLVVFATYSKINLYLKFAALSITGIVGVIALPLIFVLQAKQSNLNIAFSPASAFDFSLLNLTGFFANRFSTWFDWLYLIIDNLLWITIILAIIGIIFCIKFKALKSIYLPAILSLICFINYWLLSTTLKFEFLIEYERANYADRLLILAMLFLLPYLAIAIAGVFRFLKTRPIILRANFLVLLILIITANIYGAYPRHDNYARSAGFNVSQADYDAVYEINKMAGDEEYVVLANQSVSAAALESFGFKKYYHTDIFYYPIPTGGELYQKYLQMTDESPDRLVAIEAMDLAGVDTVFLAVNDYWWQAEKIIEQAKNQADDWFSIDDGAVTVFIYRR